MAASAAVFAATILDDPPMLICEIPGTRWRDDPDLVSREGRFSLPPDIPPLPVSLSRLRLADILVMDVSAESTGILLGNPIESTDARETIVDANDTLASAAAPVSAASDGAPLANVDAVPVLLRLVVDDTECRGGAVDSDSPKENEDEDSFGRNGLVADRWNSITSARRFVTCKKIRGGSNDGVLCIKNSDE